VGGKASSGPLPRFRTPGAAGRDRYQALAPARSGACPKPWGEPACRIAGADAGDLVRNNLQQVINSDKRVAALFA